MLEIIIIIFCIVILLFFIAFTIQVLVVEKTKSIVWKLDGSILYQEILDNARTFKKLYEKEQKENKKMKKKIRNMKRYIDRKNNNL